MSLINIISLASFIIIMAGYALFISIVLFRRKKGEEQNWNRRLGGIVITPGKQEQISKLMKESSDPTLSFKGKIAKIEGLTQWIQHSGLEINPIFFVTGSIALGFIVFLIFFLILHLLFLLSMLIGIVSSFVAPWILITFLTNRQKNKFLEDFPVALDMIQRALRAGHSSDRALEMAATQATGTMKKILAHIIDKIHLGEPPETVLAETSDRLGLDDFRMLSIVLTLQKETGGGLAEAIENFSKIIRARQTLRKKVRSLTGEVRATALILTCIPFVIVGLIYLTSPHYLDSLFYTQVGHILLFVVFVMLSTGITIIFRMAYRETY